MGGLYPGGLINGGLISRWAYIQNNIFVVKWMGLYAGEFKTRGGGGALKWDFTVFGF